MGRDHAIVLGGDHHAATRAAETARRLVPLQFGMGTFGDEVLRERRCRDASRRGRHCGGFELQHLAAIEWLVHEAFSAAAASVAWNTSAAENTSGSRAISFSLVPSAPAFDVSITTTSFPFGSRA